MNSYLTLTKTFISAISMSKPQDKKRKIIIAILSIFCIFGVLLPVSVLMGFIVKLMTDVLVTIGTPTPGLQCMLHIITLFTLVFGINVIFNELYFSNDIEYLLPWPLRARQIVGAKFTAAVSNENIMQCILVLSCVIGYGISVKLGIFNWLVGFVGVMTLPILPMAYCGIISILIMRMTKLIKNKDIVQRITVSLMFVLLVVLVISMGSLQNFDIEYFVIDLIQGKLTFFNTMDIIFPNVVLFVRAFAKGDIIALFLYVLVNTAAVVVMLILADLFYFDGVIGITSGANQKRKKALEQILNSCKMHSAAYSYFMKEVRILLRTPVFFTNCVGVNFIWPIFVYAMYKLQRAELTISAIQQLYADNDFRIRLIFLVGMPALSIIITAMNSISSGAISREGKHFAFMKYIPVPYSVQWNVKAWVGILFPLVGILVYFIPACIILKIPVLHTIIYAVICFLAITFVSYMGVYIDSIQPKLIWDDEMSSLRENFNTFFAMGMALIFTAILCVAGILLYKITGKSLLVTSIIMLFLLVTANFVALAITVTSGERNIFEQEEC